MVSDRLSIYNIYMYVIIFFFVNSLKKIYNMPDITFVSLGF